MAQSGRIKLVAWSVLALVVLAIAGRLFLSALYPADLRAQLARVFGVRPEIFWINLPPAKNRLPGASFIYESTLLAPDSDPPNPDEIAKGLEFELGWVNSTGSRLNASADAGFLGLVYGDSSGLRVQLKATKCRTLEMPVDKLKQRLLRSAEVKAQAAQGREPLVVVRSYEGLISLRIAKTASTSAETWQKVKETTKSAAGLPNSKLALKGEDQDSLEVAFTEPFVFAYEMLKAKLITTHLGAEPNDVELTPATEPQIADRSGRHARLIAESDPRHWALATVAVGHFPKVAWLQQDWNKYSAEAAKRALSRFGPTLVSSLRSSAEATTSADTILRFVDELGSTARKSGATAIGATRRGQHGLHHHRCEQNTATINGGNQA